MSGDNKTSSELMAGFLAKDTAPSATENKGWGDNFNQRKLTEVEKSAGWGTPALTKNS